MAGDVFDVIKENGTADAVVAAAYSRIGEAVLVAVAIIAACTSFAREGGISFYMFLWYRHRA